MRNHRQKRYYWKGYNDTTWSLPFDGFFDPDNEETQAARQAYREGWDDSVQITGKPNGWSFGGVLTVIGAVFVLALFAGAVAHAPAASTGTRASTVAPTYTPRQQQCSWQWRYTGKWLSNNDQTWRDEWYYTGFGFRGYDGLWYREWRYTGRRLPNNDGTSRREQKQFWICS